MPKAASSYTINLQQPYSSSVPSILKRNQACHQCRRRKLKCDAQRPCATCIRSHASARATPGIGLTPPEPECTYDEVPEPRRQTQDGPKGRYERLENRINELEDLLRQKNALEAEEQLHHTTAQSYMFTQGSSTATEAQGFSVIDYSSPSFVSARPVSHSTSSHGATPSTLGSRNASPPTTGDSPKQNTDFFQELFWPAWPTRLPHPDMLIRLVNVFFASLPHASLILHRPSFVSSLALHPTNPNFPTSSILHAICAVASLFVPEIAPAPFPDLGKEQVDDIFPENHRKVEPRDDSFGEMHAKYAKEAQAESAMLGEGLFAGTQSVVILSWYYFYHARWVDVWTSTGEALRYCTPLMLYICAPQAPLTRSWRADRALLAQPCSPIEEETRRNTFWLAYAMDRFHSAGTDFAIMLDDEDITQVLPCLRVAFEAGTPVPAKERQRLNTPRMLTTHPLDQTDTFVLYIKGAVLLSKVKMFNHRFRAKYPCTTTTPDPRETPAFKALDSTISAFSAAFPEEFQDPLANAVDSHLYVAHLVPHTAMLLLHDPHADFAKHDCSYLKLSAAAHAILDLVCLVCATNYDITLLDPIVMWCWHLAARELVREMLHMQHTGQTAQVSVLRSEVEVIRLALVRLGERIPFGYRQTKILDDLLAQEVPEYAYPYTPDEFQEMNPGSLEHLMYEGMHGMR